MPPSQSTCRRRSSTRSAPQRRRSRHWRPTRPCATTAKRSNSTLSCCSRTRCSGWTCASDWGRPSDKSEQANTAPRSWGRPPTPSVWAPRTGSSLPRSANSRGFFSAVGGVDHERVGQLERALDALGEERGATRARLLALLAQELAPAGDLERRLVLSEEAVEIARGVGDPQVLVEVLNLRFNAILGAEMLQERLQVAREASAASPRSCATRLPAFSPPCSRCSPTSMPVTDERSTGAPRRR